MANYEKRKNTMADHSRLVEVYIQNLKPFGSSITWTLPHESDGLRGRDIIVIYGKELITWKLLRLINMVSTPPSHEQRKTLHADIDNQDRSSAVILKLQADPYLYHGLVHDKGKTFKFRLSGKTITWCDVYDEEALAIERDLPECIQDGYDTIIHTILDEVTRERDNVKCQPDCLQLAATGFASDSDSCLLKGIPNESRKSPFLKSTKITKGQGQALVKIGSQEDPFSRLDQHKQRQIGFYVRLEVEITEENQVVLLTGIHYQTEIEPYFLCEAHNLLDSMKSRKKQLLIFTNSLQLPYQCSYVNIFQCKSVFLEISMRNQYFISKLCNDGLSPKMKDIADGRLKLPFAELLMFVEGKEDDRLFTCWISEIKNWLKTGSREKCPWVDEDPRIQGSKQQAILRMLEGIQIIPTNGKGNLERVTMAYRHLNVPHCIILDADALLKGASEKDRIPDPIPSELIPGSLAAKYMDQRFEASVRGIDLLHYPELTKKNTKFAEVIKTYDEKREKERRKTQSQAHPQKVRWTDYLTNYDQPLTKNKLFEKYQAHQIFAWKYGNGSSSGLIGMSKGELVKGMKDDHTILNMTLRKSETPAIRDELRRWTDFLLRDVFKHYTKFNRISFDIKDEVPLAVLTAAARNQKAKVSVAIEQNEDSKIPREEAQLLTKRWSDQCLKEYEKLNDLYPANNMEYGVSAFPSHAGVAMVTEQQTTCADGGELILPAIQNMMLPDTMETETAETYPLPIECLPDNMSESDEGQLDIATGGEDDSLSQLTSAVSQSIGQFRSSHGDDIVEQKGKSSQENPHILEGNIRVYLWND